MWQQVNAPVNRSLAPSRSECANVEAHADEALYVGSRQQVFPADGKRHSVQSQRDAEESEDEVTKDDHHESISSTAVEEIVCYLGKVEGASDILGTNTVPAGLPWRSDAEVFSIKPKAELEGENGAPRVRRRLCPTLPIIVRV